MKLQNVIGLTIAIAALFFPLGAQMTGGDIKVTNNYKHGAAIVQAFKSGERHDVIVTPIQAKSTITLPIQQNLTDFVVWTSQTKPESEFGLLQVKQSGDCRTGQEYSANFDIHSLAGKKSLEISVITVDKNKNKLVLQ